MSKEKVNGTDKVKAVPQPLYGIAFGANPAELAEGLYKMQLGGYIVDGNMFSYTMKVKRRFMWPKRVKMMCVLMVRGTV